MKKTPWQEYATRKPRLLKQEAQHGFDLTQFDPGGFAKVITRFSVSPIPMEEIEDVGGRKYSKFYWTGPGLTIITTNNPNSGEPHGTQGYAGYIGLEGDPDKVRQAAMLIKAHADVKDESPGMRAFASRERTGTKHEQELQHELGLGFDLLLKRIEILPEFGSYEFKNIGGVRVLAVSPPGGYQTYGVVVFPHNGINWSNGAVVELYDFFSEKSLGASIVPQGDLYGTAQKVGAYLRQIPIAESRLKHEHVLEVMPDESELAGRLIAASSMKIGVVEPSRNPPSRMVYYLTGSESAMSDLIDKMYENGIEPHYAEVTPAAESLTHYVTTPHPKMYESRKHEMASESVWSMLVKNFNLSERDGYRLADFLIGTPSPLKLREFIDAGGLSLSSSEMDEFVKSYAMATSQVESRLRNERRGESRQRKPVSEQVGQTIYQQLRGMDPMALMAWGAKDFVSFDNAMSVTHPGDDRLKPGASVLIGERGGGLMFKVSGPRFAGKILIGLNFMDLYDVVAGRVIGVDFKAVKIVNNVYFDQLIEVIDAIVG